MMTTTERVRGGSQTVEKALDLLEELARAPEGVRNLDVARDLGLDKSTSHRLLSTLERRGFARRDEQTKRFVLGPRLLELATGSALTSMLVARPYVHRLVALTGESASFSLLVDRSYVPVDAVQAPHEIRFALEVGRSYPLNAGATGKVILAFHRPARERLLTGELTSYAANTIVSPAELSARLAEIADRGYAVSDGERVAGGCSIAAPVTLPDGTALGALAVSSVRTRLDPEALAAYADDIRSMAAECSARIVRPNG